MLNSSYNVLHSDSYLLANTDSLWQPPVIGNQCSECWRLIRAYRRY